MFFCFCCRHRRDVIPLSRDSCLLSGRWSSGDMYLLQIKAQNTKMLDIFPVTGPVVSDGLRTSLSDWTVANSFDQANKDKHREKVLLNHQTEIYHVTRLARRAPAPAVIRLKRQSPPSTIASALGSSLSVRGLKSLRRVASTSSSYCSSV
jgi:hypothetical protein